MRRLPLRFEFYRAQGRLLGFANDDFAFLITKELRFKIMEEQKLLVSHCCDRRHCWLRSRPAVVESKSKS